VVLLKYFKKSPDFILFSFAKTASSSLKSEVMAKLRTHYVFGVQGIHYLAPACAFGVLANVNVALVYILSY
jgi:hypothetical protein